MPVPRISASSYSNTAPLVWSFLYGSNHGKVELILDNAPARSAQLLEQDRVDAALVPVITYQFIDGVRLIPGICVGAKEMVRSVCLVTKGDELSDVRSVSLDISSRTSVALTKVIFREFLGFEPEYKTSAPDPDAMLAESDCALLIGDPALRLSHVSALGIPHSAFRTFDLAELWKKHTGLGFVFAMWMTRRERVGIDFASARDEGLSHLEEIAANYQDEIGLTRPDMIDYLSNNISYSIDESMRKGLELYFELAHKNGLTERNSELLLI
jgi:chorismate dehydratase